MTSNINFFKCLGVLNVININLLFCRYSDIPQVHRAPPTAVEGGRKPRGTIGQYFATMHCPVCEQLTVEGVCPQCRRDPAKVATTLSVRMKEAEAKCSDIESVSFVVISTSLTLGLCFLLFKQ